MKKKKIIYTLQFWEDEPGTINLSEKAEQNNKLRDSFNMYRFGRLISLSNLLEREDKDGLQSFCRAFINNWKEIKEKATERTIRNGLHIDTNIRTIIKERRKNEL